MFYYFLLNKIPGPSILNYYIQKNPNLLQGEEKFRLSTFFTFFIESTCMQLYEICIYLNDVVYLRFKGG